VYTLLKGYIMKTEIEVEIKTDKYMFQEYSENITQRYLVKTYNDDLYHIVNRTTKFIKSNFDYEDSYIQIKVNDIYDPSMVKPLTSLLGRSLTKYLPFYIELGENIQKPKDYDPIWV
jgi:hypothetical protein